MPHVDDHHEAAAPLAADVVLNDGGTVHIRQLLPTDAPELQRFHARQSPESQYFRYFSAKSTLSDAEATRFCRIDPNERGALVVQDGDDMIAWASYERLTDRDDAEVAFHVDDAHAGRGIATLTLEYLGSMAAATGVRRFSAAVMADNRPMRVVFSHTGWPIERHFDGGLVEFTWPIDDTPAFLATTAKREQIADSRSMARFLLPGSIAVIGASGTVGSVGRALFEHLLIATPGVDVFAVNPAHEHILGQRCLATVDDIDTDIALAVVAVPQAALADVLRACARRRVRGAVVLTETSEDFPLADVVADARRYGMRIIGPGSMGIAHPVGTHPVHAHLASPHIPGGGLAVSLQAGSLGASVLERAARLGVGISWFVSLGIKADVSGNDLLQFWEDDAATRVIAMYTESFGNPRRFVRIARRVALNRPIVAVRPGNSTVHDALYQQAGVIRVDTVAEMLDTARLLALQPLATGVNVAVVTNSAGPARLLIASLQAAGLQPSQAGTSGEHWQQLPLAVDPQTFAQAVQAQRTDASSDAVIALYAPPAEHSLATFTRDFAAATAVDGPVPLLCVFLGVDDGPLHPGSQLPNFAFPDDVARVLGRTVRYRQWRELQQAAADAALDQEPAEPSADDARVRTVIDRALDEHPQGTTLSTVDANELLAALGIPVAPTQAVTTSEQAISAAQQCGYPVALKTPTRRQRGRGREAGVALELRSAEAVAQAWQELFEHAPTSDAVVQTMVSSGIDCRVHARLDPELGPVISVGLGGVLAGDVDRQDIRLIPLTTGDGSHLLHTALAGQVLDHLGASVPAAVAVIDAVSDALDRYHEIAEIDLNPIIISQHGCWATDVVVRVGAHNKPDSPMRHLNDTRNALR